MNVRKMMACSFINITTSHLNRYAYNGLHEDRKNLIQSWFYRAREQRNCTPAESFDPFIFTWISFNGWASCVTDKERDIDIVKLVANCTDLQNRFAALRSSEPDFADVVNKFAKLWPIFKTRDIHKHYDYSPPSDNREDIIKAYLNHADIRFAPDCALYHREHNEEIPRDWPHTLHAVYQVRCNLFHGGKSPYLETDALIIKSAFDVLMEFLNRTEIIVSNH